MKTIVLAANDDQGLDGGMGQHFGHGPFYVIVRVNGSHQVETTQIKAKPHVEQGYPLKA